jgi:hypothetical protein
MAAHPARDRSLRVGLIVYFAEGVFLQCVDGRQLGMAQKFLGEQVGDELNFPIGASDFSFGARDQDQGTVRRAFLLDRGIPEIERNVARGVLTLGGVRKRPVSEHQMEILAIGPRDYGMPSVRRRRTGSSPCNSQWGQRLKLRYSTGGGAMSPCGIGHLLVQLVCRGSARTG